MQECERAPYFQPKLCRSFRTQGLILFHFCIFETVFLCGPGWSGTHSIAQISLK